MNLPIWILLRHQNVKLILLSRHDTHSKLKSWCSPKINKYFNHKPSVRLFHRNHNYLPLEECLPTPAVWQPFSSSKEEVLIHPSGHQLQQKNVVHLIAILSKCIAIQRRTLFCVSSMQCMSSERSSGNNVLKIKQKKEMNKEI